MNPTFPRTLSSNQKLINNLFSTAFLAAKKPRMSCTFTDNAGSLSNSYNNVVTATAADEEPQISAWLSPLKPQVRHRDISNLRVDNMGNPLLGTKEFVSWYEGSSHAVLFCYGNPGAGKSYIWYE